MKTEFPASCPELETCLYGGQRKWTVSRPACKLGTLPAVTKTMRLSLILLALLAIAAGPVSADEAADRIERANLLRQLLEDGPPLRAGASDAGAELPAAKIENRQQDQVERLQVERFKDGQWRRLLETQRAKAHRPDPTPTPSGSGLVFEREQQARDLSIQIQRQDLEYRQINRR